MRGGVAVGALLLAAGSVAATGSVARAAKAEILGWRPPEWEIARWLDRPPLILAELRGRVVLVRWWTAPYCSFCRASAPALNDFHARYRDRGLVVVGLYHHKSPGLLDPQAVARWAAELGFEFPVGIDEDWRTLSRWWLDREPASDWTSVTFLIDREGVVRHIHSGGQYVAGDADHAALEAKIEELLAEPAPTPASAQAGETVTISRAAPRRWHGTPVSLSLKDADLREVLRSFARLTRVNLVLDPRVRGSVTLELDQVPWDQALHLILKTHGLAADIDGRVWAVTPTP